MRDFVHSSASLRRSSSTVSGWSLPRMVASIAPRGSFASAASSRSTNMTLSFVEAQGGSVLDGLRGVERRHADCGGIHAELRGQRLDGRGGVRTARPAPHLIRTAAEKEMSVHPVTTTMANGEH
jgi:hypothetical protein